MKQVFKSVSVINVTLTLFLHKKEAAASTASSGLG